jgi:hypothetical protein
VSRAKGGRYQFDENTAEAWGGLFAAYVAEDVPLGPWPRQACLDADKQAASGSFETFLADPWLQLCLLMELKEAHGWALFARFFEALPSDWEGVLPQKPTARDAWAWTASALAAVADEDVSATFTRFKVPAP